MNTATITRRILNGTASIKAAAQRLHAKALDGVVAAADASVARIEQSIDVTQQFLVALKTEALPQRKREAANIKAAVSAERKELGL